MEEPSDRHYVPIVLHSHRFKLGEHRRGNGNANYIISACLHCGQCVPFARRIPVDDLNGAEQTPCTGGLSELLITSAGPSSSNPTTITYTLASDPGSNNCAGTFKFPDVRQFDERVYQADNASTAATPTCSANCAGTYTGSVVVTFANSNGGTTVMCGAVSPTTPVTNGSGTGCSTGTNIGTGATANVTISSSETYNVVAGTSLLADSSVLSEAYTINAATTAPSRVMGLLN